jgi:hypothetical protein
MNENLYEWVNREYQEVPLLYIAGPFTSSTPEQLAELTNQASDVALKAWKKGWSVISVHKNCLGYTASHKIGYKKWMAALIAQIVRCDALLLLPGWEKSSGVQIEKKVAEDLNIPVYKYEIHGVPKPSLKYKLEENKWH